MERFCLCNKCVGAIRSRGERILTRPMEFDDCTNKEAETDNIVCDWCEEEFCESEMNIVV